MRSVTPNIAEPARDSRSHICVESELMAAVKKIEAELMRLPATTRARIAARLIESLDYESEDEREKAWIVEAERRDAELRSGEIKGVSARAVFKRVKSTLR